MTVRVGSRGSRPSPLALAVDRPTDAGRQPGLFGGEGREPG